MDVYLLGAIFTALFAFPFFWLIQTGQRGWLTVAIVAALLAHSAMYGPQASFFSELFGTRVRYSGASLGYQLASVIAGGFSPLIATSLLHRFNHFWPITVFIIGLSLISAISVYLAAETAHQDIHRESSALPAVHAKTGAN